jgi:hypothetical protein
VRHEGRRVRRRRLAKAATPAMTSHEICADRGSAPFAMAQPPLLPAGLEPASGRASGAGGAASGGPPESVPASLPPDPALHLLVLVSHTGLLEGQSVLFSHSTHEPFEHTSPPGLPAQSPLLVQASHVPDPHTGLGFLHCDALSHLQVCVAMSHDSDPQSAFVTHCTHAPVDVSQTPVVHSPLEHARHVREAPSQMGLSPEQFMSLTQPTHVNVSE